MDPRHFDELVRTLPGMPRRRLLAALASGLLVSQAHDQTDAKKGKDKKRKKKLQRNDFDCVDVGKACRGSDANCCSGICDGKKPKKGEKDKSRCAAHDATTCIPGQRELGCGGTVEVDCTTTAGKEGVCDTTTGNGAYCVSDGDCFVCKKDVDCIPFCGPQAACITCVPGCDETGGTACVGPDECSFPPEM